MTRRRLGGCLITLLLLGITYLIASFGYCRGWWGKENLILRSLWLCTCSKKFEQSLYPENVEVLVSARECTNGHRQILPFESFTGECKPPRFSGVPGGRKIFVENDFIDLYTKQKTPANLPSGYEIWGFLTDELALLYKRNTYVFDLTNQKLVEVKEFHLQPGSDMESLIEAMKKAEKVFVLHDSMTIVLGIDYWNHPDRNFHFSDLDMPSIKQQGMEAFLQDNGITYLVGASPQDTYVGLSPDGKYQAKLDGVYLTNTEQKIVDFNILQLPSNVRHTPSENLGGVLFVPRYWRSDSKAIVLDAVNGFHDYHHPILVVFELLPPFALYLSLPQPLLLVNLPVQLDQPTPVP